MKRPNDEHDAAVWRQQLTFVVIGGGPTGVEMAGAVAETARHTLRGQFRRIDPTAARIYLVEGTEQGVERLSTEALGPRRGQVEDLRVARRYVHLSGNKFDNDFNVCAQTGHIARDRTYRQQIAVGYGQSFE